jgi:subtilisin family serine protease
MITLAQAREALATGTGRGVRVAIIDSGVDPVHPRLTGLTLRDDVAVVSDGVQLRVEDGGGHDAYGHGTAIAGVIRALAPEAELGSFRVLDAELASRTIIIREGVRQAMDRDYQVLNCSFGCRGDARFVMDYKAWIDEAYLTGRHVVAACNNFDFSTPEWPGWFPTVNTVNMARLEGARWLRRPGHLVEFAAAGHDVEVAWTGGGARRVTGSSYAAPVVSALLARLLSVHPEVSPLEAKALLQRLAEPFEERAAGVNVRSAAGDR